MGFWSNLAQGLKSGQSSRERQPEIMVDRTEGDIKERVPLSWVKEDMMKKTYEKEKTRLVLAKAEKEAKERAEREVNPPVRQNPFGFQNWARGTQVKSHATHKLPPPAFLNQVIAKPKLQQRPQIRQPRNFTEFMQNQFGGGSW